jgi:hypothetical protein
MSILFSFIVFILCSNLYIIVDFCAKSIFFYDIYVKEGREKTKKKSHFGGTSSYTYQFYSNRKKYTKNIILTVPSFVLIFVFILLFYFLIRRVR